MKGKEKKLQKWSGRSAEDGPNSLRDWSTGGRQSLLAGGLWLLPLPSPPLPPSSSSPLPPFPRSADLLFFGWLGGTQSLPGRLPFGKATATIYSMGVLPWARRTFIRRNSVHVPVHAEFVGSGALTDRAPDFKLPKRQKGLYYCCLVPYRLRKLKKDTPEKTISKSEQSS